MARAAAKRLELFGELGLKDIFGDAEPSGYEEVLRHLEKRQ
jgi:hypothetical protein